MGAKIKFKRVAPYQDDEMNLPVDNVDEAVPYYEKIMGFSLEFRQDTPVKAAVLSRDGIRIGLAENGGDPEQEGCFFEVDDVEAAYDELQANGLGKAGPDFRVDRHGDKNFKVFFVIAPDRLCYCLGQEQPEG
jgi:lactoylglutathione lyase